MSKKIPSLDGLRAISILLVIFWHVYLSIPRWTSKYLFGIQLSGAIGVLIFFVISGFLITTLLLKEKNSHSGKVSVRLFYARRFFRIVPVNYLYISVVLLCNKAFSFVIPSSDFWHAFTYIVNFAGCSWLLGHLWSLSVEEQFYFFWPWITKATVKKITIAAIAIICYAPCIRVISYLNPHLGFIFLGSFFIYADSLMIGSLLAISRYSWPALWKSPLLHNRSLFVLSILTICLTASFTTATHLIGHHTGFITVPLWPTIISFCAAYIIAASTTIGENSLRYRILNHPVIVYIGTLSYSLYIWQQFFLVPADFPNMPVWWRVFPVNVLLVFCVSALSYHVWEKCFLTLKDRFRASAIE